MGRLVELGPWTTACGRGTITGAVADLLARAEGDIFDAAAMMLLEGGEACGSRQGTDVTRICAEDLHESPDRLVADLAEASALVAGVVAILRSRQEGGNASG